MNGKHGQVVQQHVVKEFKQGQEHVSMMLKTLPSHSLSKRIATILQQTGDIGQVALQHVVKAAKQEQESVVTILQAPTMSRKLTKKLATSKNAVMTLGQHGVHGIHAPIVGPFRLNDDAHDKDSSKFPLVHKWVKRYNTNIKR